MPELPWIIVAAAVAIAVVVYLIQRKKDRPMELDSHEFFTRVWLWPKGAHVRWEADLDTDIPGTSKTVGFHSEAEHDEVPDSKPTAEEVAFCRARLADLDGLFELARPAVLEAWKDWGKGEMPADWRSVLSLDGLSAPNGGDLRRPWAITYFCEPAGHYFCIEVRKGKAHLESVDG